MPTGAHFKGTKPINKPGKRATDAEVNIRVSFITKLLIQEYKRHEIISVFSEKYKISISQIDEYIAKAKMLIFAKNEETLENEIQMTKEQIMDGYRNAKKDRRWGDVARFLKLKMELKGLEAPKQIQLSGGMTIKESDLTRFGDEGLSEEEKEFAREITGLSE